MYKASNTNQNMIHLYICFYYHPFFKFECHWTQNANLKKAIWMIIAIHYYYLRLMSGGFCNQHPLSIYISRLSFTHINAINLWSMKTLPQGGDGAKVKLETHYRVFSNINIQTAPDNSGALRDQQTIIYTEYWHKTLLLLNRWCKIPVSPDVKIHQFERLRTHPTTDSQTTNYWAMI